MNRLTAESGSSVPVEKIKFNTSVQSSNTSRRVETTLFQKLSPKKIPKNSNVFKTHAHSNSDFEKLYSYCAIGFTETATGRNMEMYDIAAGFLVSSITTPVVQ